MKYVVMLFILFLVGCSTTDHLYYDATKAVSKDNTVAQTACWAAVSEISKGGDSSVKVAAIALAEKCKATTVVVEPPKKNMLGF